MCRKFAGNFRRQRIVREFNPANVQDAYTLRCIPQVHGACRDAIAYAEWAINIELNAVTDNPLIFCDENAKKSKLFRAEIFTANRSLFRWIIWRLHFRNLEIFRKDELCV